MKSVTNFGYEQDKFEFPYFLWTLYNISLLKYDTHGPTQEFADLLYSHSLLPCITKPTRVTAKSASLIDNIFCNSVLYDDHAFTVILYTDISDHFPFFFISMAHLKRRILLCI